MPFFFFIAGASNVLGRKRTLLRFYASRFQRILLPYWIYGILCILITAAAKRIIPLEQKNYFSFTIPTLFSPLSKLPYLTGALWFVPIYLFVILLFPLLKWYYEQYENDIKNILPLILFALLLINKGWEVLYEARMILFYGFWMYLGLFFSKLDWYGSVKSKRNILPGIIICAGAVLWFLQKNRDYANMQTNKFPPNIVFLIYTFGALSVFYLLSSYILKGICKLRKNFIFNWIYKQYIDNCYTIFLYHPFSFLFLYIVLQYSGLRAVLFKNEWLCLSLYILVTIPMNAVIGKIFSWCEKIKIKEW